MTNCVVPREGPSVTITKSCRGCMHCVSERYKVQSDSGTDIYCCHSSEKRYIGDTNWSTPSWCPVESAPQDGGGPFQRRVNNWMQRCFGEKISSDTTERNHRFLEESLELVQSLGCTASEAHQLVDYVFNRDIGEPIQEVGGVCVTLSALCNAASINENLAAETELERINMPGLIDKIRAKQAAKPKHSPLPAHSSSQPAQEWISVKDRMPDTNEPVVYKRPNRNGKIAVGIAYWTVSGKWQPEEESALRPTGFTHWMPLPQPQSEGA